MCIQDFKDVLEILISTLGIVIPLVVLIKEHYGRKRHKLAEQVIAYWCLQEEAVQWIKQLDPNAKNVKEQLRQKAQANKDNVLETYPTMALREATKEL